jgi:YgiT-type zinc finger domain-containing protein
MKCSIIGCPGEYESRRVVHTARRGDRTIVIEEVPAEVCSVCGDTLFSAETVRSLESLLASPPLTSHLVPAFTYPLGGVPGESCVG